MVVRRYEGGKTLFIAERRSSDYLRPPHREYKAAGMTEVVANRGQSCTGACMALGATCSGPQLPFVNSCEAMQRNFKCEGGCGHQVGQEIPCYVTDASQATYRQCLTTDGAPNDCDAKHPSTQRLCACVR